MSDETITAAPGTPDPPATGTLTSTPAAPTTPTGTGTIQLTVEDYRKLLDDQNAMKAQREAEAIKAQKADSDRLKTLAEKEGIEVALRKVQEQQAEAERKHKEEVGTYQTRLLDYQKRTEMNRHLLGVGWVSDDAARDAEAKMASQFESVEVNGQVVVRQVGTGKPPAEAIPELLKTSAYQHFLKAGTAGGAGAGGTHKPGGTEPFDPKQRARDIVSKALQAHNSDAIGLSGLSRMPAQN